MAKPLSDRLYAAIKRSDIPLPPGPLMRILSLKKGQRKKVLQVLKHLVKDGRIAKTKAGYVAAGRAAQVQGRLVGHPDGFGFVIREDGEEDVFVPRREMAGAMHGDTVTIQVVPGRDGRTAAAGVKVIERGAQQLVGRLERHHHRWRMVPLEGKINRDVLVDAKGAKQAREGDLVAVRITRYPERGEAMAGKVVEVFGDGSDPSFDSPMALADAGVEVSFSDPVLEQAERLPKKLSKEHRKGRVDLRELPTVTIDGEHARDFDDAVSLRQGENGGVTLWVHIADVDHFAPEGSILDVSARERATSIYLPDRVVPMFPEALSNGICSLNPEVERLTLTAEMDFNKDGRRTSVKLYPSVTRSDARLTYNEVNSILVDGDNALRDKRRAQLAMLEAMEVLSRKRSKIRTARGSIDFDLPETMVELGEGGEIRDIVHQEREISHRMIEEFMLSANEAVAGWLTEGEWPCVYRVHEDPDPARLAAWVPVARNILGKDINIPDFLESPPPKALQQVLDKAAEHPAADVLASLLIRSLKQARYTGTHIGHYGLAAETYCHFTSPIRRYPDLMIHRLVKARLNKQPFNRMGWVSDLEGISAHASDRERRAMAIERRVVAIKKCRYLECHLGEEMEGVISSVARFGLFVTLEGAGFDGMLPVESLPGRVGHDERHMVMIAARGQRFQVGDAIRVKVRHVDALAGKVTLDLA
ncbi:MAG: ribonuclease R [Leptospirillia bacterium]